MSEAILQARWRWGSDSTLGKHGLNSAYPELGRLLQAVVHVLALCHGLDQLDVKRRVGLRCPALAQPYARAVTTDLDELADELPAVSIEYYDGRAQSQPENPYGVTMGPLVELDFLAWSQGRAHIESRYAHRLRSVRSGVRPGPRRLRPYMRCATEAWGRPRLAQIVAVGFA